MVMRSFFFGERYTRLILEFPFPFEWRSAVLMNTPYTLVATVGNSVSICLEVYSRALEKFKIMRFTFGKVSRYNPPRFLVNHYLAFGGVSFLLAGVVLALSFFGRSTGDSLASMSATSMTISDLSRAFLPGKENC